MAILTASPERPTHSLKITIDYKKNKVKRILVGGVITLFSICKKESIEITFSKISICN